RQLPRHVYCAVHNRLRPEPQASIQRRSRILLVHAKLQPAESTVCRNDLRLPDCPSANALALMLRNNLKIPQPQRAPLRKKPQKPHNLRLPQDHQILELRPAGSETRGVPSNAPSSEIPVHVQTVEGFTEGE